MMDRALAIPDSRIPNSEFSYGVWGMEISGHGQSISGQRENPGGVKRGGAWRDRGGTSDPLGPDPGKEKPRRGILRGVTGG